MFKSCQYCRHRRKRCVFPTHPSTDSRCLACQHLNVTCELATRRPSEKRQQTSQRVATRVLASSHSSRHPELLAGANDGDCQLPVSAINRSAKELLLPNAVLPTNLDTRQLYDHYVRFECPFVPEECFHNDSISSRLDQCLSLAASMSFQLAPNTSGTNTTQAAELITAGALELSTAAGLLTLICRRVLQRGLVIQVFDYLSTYSQQYSLPVPIAAGTVAAHTWQGLSNEKISQPPIPIDLLNEYATELESGSFAPHFLKLTHLGARLALLLYDDAKEHDQASIRQWARLEHACLLNVAEMRSEFLDVRDDMLATPAAVVTHMLQNLIYLRLYRYLLHHRPDLGEALGLRPVPGMLNFLCAISRSTFICQPEILHYWPLITEIQAEAARTMIYLWISTKFENCRALLKLWKPTSGHEELVRRAEELTSTPSSVEVIDGYSVFWTFRDIRSLALEFLLRSD